MYSIRGNGDNIAQEFFNILGNGQSLKKVAEVQEDHVKEEDNAEDSVNYAEDPTGDDLTDEELRGLLVDGDSAESEVDYNIDLQDQIDQMVDYAEDGNHEKSASKDPSGQYIMHGLGKIAAGLRNKGEGFAADVVEATAFSIRGDLVKEADRKGNIVSSLEKLASEFANSGDSFAADMVKATIIKIQ